MSDDVKLKSLSGKRAVWDGGNDDDVREVAGDAFTSVRQGQAVIVFPNGEMTWLAPGWCVIRWENGVLTTHAGHSADALVESA